jgi:dynein heavy chain 2
MRERAESFKPDVIARASVAAAPLAAWVQAVVRHSIVLERVAPLEAELGAAAGKLAAAQGELGAANRELGEVDARVAALKTEFGARTAEAEALRAALAKSEDVLLRARALLGALAGEAERWAARRVEIAAAEEALPGEVLLGAAAAVYLGGADEDAAFEGRRHAILVRSGPDGAHQSVFAAESASEAREWCDALQRSRVVTQHV